VAIYDEVRAAAQRIAARPGWARIDMDRLEQVADEWAAEGLTPEPSELDAERHFLEGSREDVAAYLLALDAINFGSGWFPTLRKREGCSGYYTVSWALADHWRATGGWSPAQLRQLTTAEVARVLGQDPGNELMGLYAQALRDLGMFLSRRTALEEIEAAGGSADRLARRLVDNMPYFEDWGFFKRAQITANDLQLAGISQFEDIDRLTIFADNLVPHVLRLDGVLTFEERLEAKIDRGELLEFGAEERDIRGCAVHACELLSERLGIAPRLLDVWLWNRGQGERYKAVPRHRCRTTAY
jgi:hypothetical protein